MCSWGSHVTRAACEVTLKPGDFNPFVFMWAAVLSAGNLARPKERSFSVVDDTEVSEAASLHGGQAQVMFYLHTGLTIYLPEK